MGGCGLAGYGGAAPVVCCNVRGAQSDFSKNFYDSFEWWREMGIKGSRLARNAWQLSIRKRSEHLARLKWGGGGGMTRERHKGRGGNGAVTGETQIRLATFNSQGLELHEPSSSSL